MTPPLFVSVIIPAHNSASFLAEAVASILGQGHHPLEIVIVDDGSTDDTGAVAAGLQSGADGQIRVVSQPQAGPAAARNRGIGLARGSMIGFLDADDLWPEGSLECRLAPFLANTSLAVVLGRSRFLWMPEGEGHAGEVSLEAFPSPLLGSALFRRSAFDEVGVFNPDLRYSEDVDWFLRARERGIALVTIEPATLLYRRHLSNMTRGKSVTDLQVMEVLKRSLDRRRQSGVARPLPPMSSEGNISP